MKNKFLSSSSLKILAITVMFIDHFGASKVYGLLSGNFFNPTYYDDPVYIIIRTIGRLAFPIFAFFIAEGFYHTLNKYKYLLRLTIFAFISEIPYDLAFNAEFPIKSFKSLFVFSDQNVFFTLALGLISIILFDMLKNIKDVSKGIHVFFLIIGFLLVLAIGYSADLVNTDYGFLGVLMIFCFYYFHGNFTGISISTFIINLLMIQMAIFYTLMGRKLPFISYDQMFSVLSLVFIYFYNNKRGYNLKYFFYWFYPVHLFSLFCLKYILLK